MEIDLYFELSRIIYWVVFQFKMIFLYWAAGTVAGSLISVFLSSRITKLVSRQGARKLGILAVIPAALLGAASPICMYGTVPLIASLGRKGVPQHILAAFMLSSILINPNLFLFSFALGTPIALARLISCLLAGVAAGILVRVFFRDREFFCYEGFEEKRKGDPGEGKLRIFLGDLNRAVLKTAPYFLVGILLAALFECYFPKSVIVDLFSRNKGFGVLTAASLGIPVYVCGGGTIPLLKSFLDAGMGTGSALAFMISGPATKITNLSAVKIILGMRNFVLYIAFSMLFAVGTGWIADLLF